MGLCLCLLLATSTVQAKQKKKPMKEKDVIKQVYNQLFHHSRSSKAKRVKHVKKRVQRRAQKKGYRKVTVHERAIWNAKKQLRKKYRWGGASPATGFDCSGLMQYAFKLAKVSIPRTARAQYKHSKRIPLSKIKAGDLIFFHTRRTRVRVNHVGLYLGNGKFIHAPRKGKRVSVAKLNSYWRRKAVGAGRLN